VAKKKDRRRGLRDERGEERGGEREGWTNESDPVSVLWTCRESTYSNAQIQEK
jgi:hypothetical protein